MSLGNGNWIRGNDTVRGTDATFYMEIEEINEDGSRGAKKRYDFIHAKNFESTAEISSDDVPRIGTRVVGKKNGTITYSGSANVYYCDPRLRKVFSDYVNTGIWPEITATVINYDKDSRAGSQTTVHKGVKFDSITLAKFDAESTMLDEDIDFTFEEVIITDAFDALPGTDVSDEEMDSF